MVRRCTNSQILEINYDTPMFIKLLNLNLLRLIRSAGSCLTGASKVLQKLSPTVERWRHSVPPDDRCGHHILLSYSAWDVKNALSTDFQKPASQHTIQHSRDIWQNEENNGPTLQNKIKANKPSSQSSQGK